MPRVSFITACYNAGPYIAQTIESALAQDYQDWEMVILDDGSTDDSAAVAQSYADREPRIRLLRQTNTGAPIARCNAYHAIAPDSEYIWYLDADDRLKPGAMTRLVGYLDARPDVGMVACEYDFINASGGPYQPGSHEYGAVWRYQPTRTGIRAIPDSDPVTPFMALFCWCRVLPSASVIRRSVYARTPGYRPEFNLMGHDTDVILHCALQAPVHFLLERLVEYRRHDAQMTAQLQKIRDGEKVMERLWLEGAFLTPEQRETVRLAQQFKERRFRPHLWTRWGHDYRRDGDWRAALRCYAKGLKTRVTA